MKRKKEKFFLTFWSGDLNPRFSGIFLPMIWIFIWSEELEIKWKQVSERDMTLLEIFLITLTLEENANNFSLLQNTGMKPNTIWTFWLETSLRQPLLPSVQSWAGVDMRPLNMAAHWPFMTQALIFEATFSSAWRLFLWLHYVFAVIVMEKSLTLRTNANWNYLEWARRI